MHSYGFDIEGKNQTPSQVHQVHGSEVLEFTDTTPRTSPLPAADAVWTRLSDVAIHIFTADCLPILLSTEDPGGPVAAIHCGWRGALRGIVPETLRIIPATALQLSAVFGPSIGPCCFQVREDFIRQWKEAGLPVDNYLVQRNTGSYFDLPRFVKETQLKELQPGRIFTTHWRCTYCSTPKLPSFRRNKTTEHGIRAWIRKSTS